jgi:hypothetical protein
MRENEYTFVILLGMQAFLLLDEYKSSTATDNSDKRYQSGNEAEETVCDDETEDGTTNSCRCPVDVTPLQAHELKRFLQTSKDLKLCVLVHLFLSLANAEE